MNDLNAINSLFPDGSTAPPMNSLLSTGSPVNFGSVFDQAMSQATTPGQKAKVQWLQTEYSDLNILYGMSSDSSASPLSFMTSDLFGVGGPFGIPSWAYDLQRLEPGNSLVQQLTGIQQQASQVLQTQFGNDLGSLGLDGGFDSLA